MGSIHWPLLLLIILLIPLHVIAIATINTTQGKLTAPNHCLPDQAAALLQLKQSFTPQVASTTTLPTWRIGTDCCHWEGVFCDAHSGRVTVLDLGGYGLSSNFLDPVLFDLTSLQHLDLSGNYLNGFAPHARGFERLSMLTHLNLSNSAFLGQVPIGIAQLTNLISLDLSTKFGLTSWNNLWLIEPNFQTLVANLSNLRELFLDHVDISISRDKWCPALAKSIPQLRVLSLESCRLYGSVCPALSSLHSLTVINLNYNDEMFGVVPEFFADFSSLSVLQLADDNLDGWFPPRIFELKNLSVLDVFYNPGLLVQLTDFPAGSSLEILNLISANFSIASLSSFSNLKSLKTLCLDARDISGMLPSGVLKYLNTLQLTGNDGSSTDTVPAPSWAGDFKYLTSLKLHGFNFSEAIPNWMANLKHLISLELDDCSFSATTSCWLYNHTFLKSLELWNCSFPMPPPCQSTKLTQLTRLDVGQSNFNGNIQMLTTNLTQLTYLNLAGNDLSGPIPDRITDLVRLTDLELFENNLSGPIPRLIANLTKLTYLNLADNAISGPIPRLIANLSKLTYLDLERNVISGDIPEGLFTLPALRRLYLRSNRFGGLLPDFSTSFSSLIYVDLSANELTGMIPKSFYNLISLKYLSLDSNNFTGTVELDSFWRGGSIFGLDLSHNKLSVIDGQAISQLSAIPVIRILGLRSCNLKKIPSILRYQNQISRLDLSSNYIRGVIPKHIWENGKDTLMSLNLSHNMFTSLEQPSFIVPMTSLQYLDLSFNKLQGHIPIPLMSPTFISEQLLDYSNNKFSYVIPNFTAYLSQTIYLKMSRNKLNGCIPHSVCNASNLQVLDLSYNNFSGPIPACLLENGIVSILNLRDNNFQGTLHHNIKPGCALQTMDLNGNRIEGNLPKSLSTCSFLEVLDLGNNHIVDSFPSWLGKLPQLRVLVLRSNQFYGSVGNPLGNDTSRKQYFSSLQIMDLASNNFSGNLHLRWFEMFKSLMNDSDGTGQILQGHNLSHPIIYQDVVTVTNKGLVLTYTKILTTLKVFDFSHNAFGGAIPESVGTLVSLHGLNMSHNAFTGQIPPQLGSMRQLESLDLSSNQLSGEIPPELANLNFLSSLNLSYNHLVGRIPGSTQFSTFGDGSFEGNAGLCGASLSNKCGNSNNSSEVPSSSFKHGSVDIVLFLFIGLGFGIGFATAIVIKLEHFSKWCKNIRSISQT